MFFCLAAAAAFGAMGVLGKLSYDEGATVGTLLSLRFAIAAALFWLVVPRRELRGLARRDVAIGLGLGAGVYALQAGMYFTALARIDASLLSLLCYTFPAIVAVAAVALGRERFDRRKTLALCLASGGLALVVASAGTGALDPLGTALGLATAVVYSGYILVGEGIARRVPARALAALVASGAALTLTGASAAIGQLHPERLSAAGWGWLVVLALVATVAALILQFAGLRRVGPTTASILSNAEPVVTVALAFAVFGEVLAPLQLVGGALVLAGVVVLSGGGAARRVSRRRRVHGAAAGAAEERTPDAREAGRQRSDELAERVQRLRLHEHGLDLRDRARAALVTPRHVQVLAADDLGQVRGQDEIGVRVIDRQMKVRHLS
ncbi:MAG TPA: EamA family transporter [Solirubrobacteraceae bacterium]|nr:EamA family transporter [Solirubrobacteraceae bacterium]